MVDAENRATQCNVDGTLLWPTIFPFSERRGGTKGEEVVTNGDRYREKQHPHLQRHSVQVSWDTVFSSTKVSVGNPISLLAPFRAIVVSIVSFSELTRCRSGIR